MSAIPYVKLELLRPGPAHNQLLSPLVPYIALCGGAGPVTVHLPFEHRELLSRLERLRYATASGEVPLEQRRFEVRDIGEKLGQVLGEVKELAPELGNARDDSRPLVHLRLSISALELALVPFELAIAPEGFPGSGSALFVQSHAPISITREVRRGRLLPVSWNRTPRVLFAFAQPAKFAAVPAAEHLNALRRAIDPWVKWQSDEPKRVAEVRKLLTVLPNASLEDVRAECSKTEYTHVHFLAHGALLEKGEGRFGIALCDARDHTSANIVDGETLATALTMTDTREAAGRRPTLVSLATCDSGQVGSVMTPGGSIAHELNAAGIPWVVASQFPLWMRASTIAVDELYSGLLRGEDPRWVLYKLRQRLRADFASTHDWASIVAYATVPENFEAHVENFRNSQFRKAVETKFDRAEKYAALGQVWQQQLDALYTDIRQQLKGWCAELPASAPAAQRSERLGLSAASEKRIGTLAARARDKPAARAAYDSSLAFYRSAMQADPFNHWVITQYLSMLAIRATTDDDLARLAKDHNAIWIAVHQIATWDLQGAKGERAAWALGTLLELELLGTVYAGERFDAVAAAASVDTMCMRLRAEVGDAAFPVYSTHRQFQRYLDDWPNDRWTVLAQIARDGLAPSESWLGRAYVPGA